MEQSDQIVKDLKSAKVVCLVGKWGSGKTYNWDNNISNKFKKTIYISLFGKRSTEEIKRELLDKLIFLITFIKLFIIIFILILTILTLSTSIINIINIFLDFFKYKLNIYINISISLIISIFLSCLFSKPILKFLALKSMGIDHTNIDWKLITPIKKTVLCFDDIERIQDKSSIIGFCGFIEELKRLGFSILLIINDEKIDEYWKDYKEKIIDVQYNQKIESTLEEIFIKYTWLKDVEKKYLTNIHNKLSKAPNELNLFKDSDHEYIKQISNNFRFITKVIKSIYNVRNIIREYYEKLEEEQQLNIISYITARTLITELGINDNDLLDGENSGKDEKEIEKDKIFNFSLTGIGEEKSRIGNLITYKNELGLTWVSCEIKKFLETKEYDLDKLKSDIFDIISSEVEIFAKNYNSLWTLTKNSRIFEKKLYNKIIKSKKPFNSFDGMKQSILQYLLATNAINKELSEEKNKQFFDVLKNNININISIDKIDNVYKFINNSNWNENTIFYKNSEILNKYFKEILKEKHIKHLKNLQNKDFFIILINELNKQSYSSFYNSLILFVLSSDSEKLNCLSQKKKENFEEYCKIIYLIINREEAIKEKLLEYFISISELEDFNKWLEEDINKLEDIEDYGYAENNAKENLLEKLNKLN